ncbi:ester cyclase [Streptomyces phaeochromogenes]|uniref:ester cyclase n=1 Tax=Streptomyces phaeochromogenes TaxID=1923 RepID=UPI002254CF82|nr:ester cyclase [Streptomyces phaeochromogenes]MCX5599233.1 ester cyclase [Streptomyces phaeochromogenes]
MAEMTTTTEKNLALLRTAYKTLEHGDLDACVELLTENFIANVPGVPDPLHGPQIWRLGAQAMWEGFPDLQISVEDMFGAGDKVAVRVHFRGTHRGTFQGIPATDRQVSFRSVELYRIEGDRIAEEWVAPDMISLMQQISPTPADH